MEDNSDRENRRLKALKSCTLEIRCIDGNFSEVNNKMIWSYQAQERYEKRKAREAEVDERWRLVVPPKKTYQVTSFELEKTSYWLQNFEIFKAYALEIANGCIQPPPTIKPLLEFSYVHYYDGTRYILDEESWEDFLEFGLTIKVDRGEKLHYWKDYRIPRPRTAEERQAVMPIISIAMKLGVLVKGRDRTVAAITKGEARFVLLTAGNTIGKNGLAYHDIACLAKSYSVPYCYIDNEPSGCKAIIARAGMPRDPILESRLQTAIQASNEIYQRESQRA